MSDIDLSFMGICEPERFRARVYLEGDKANAQRVAFLRELATDGVLDCPAYDTWVRALQERGWLPSEPDFENAPGGGRYARWRLTPSGLLALTRLSEEGVP